MLQYAGEETLKVALISTEFWLLCAQDYSDFLKLSSIKDFIIRTKHECISDLAWYAR
jgi:hypothetical protein